MTFPPPAPAAIAAQQNPPATPEWAKDAVWYQIFPERFRNGAPQSNPHPEDIGGVPFTGWRVSPWGMDWYACDNWEQPHAANFWTTVFQRRFGGDLVGVREQLPYLQQLGVNALYFNPIFWAPSLHKYDATALHHIDPTLGPDRDGDLRALSAANETEDPATWIWTAADRYFLDLVAEAHARGMKVILDGVFNHSGTGCFAFQDVRRQGPKSRYADWYQISEWRAGGTFAYASWDGTGTLPNFGRDAETLNPGIKQYQFAITRRWMDPSGAGRPAGGVDGWRLDVAYCVPHGFWREWHAFARGINPEVYTTAEIVGPAQDWLRPDEFSAVMNYEWTYPTLSFFTPHPQAIGAAEFQQRINTLHARHEPGTVHILQNLLDSHDTGRVLTMLESTCPPFSGWDEYFHWAKAANNPGLVTRQPGTRAKQALKLAVAWQFAGPGAPMIYYGTEVGMWGANDPCCRQPMLWSDIVYDDEAHGYHGPLPQATPRRPDGELLAYYQRWIALRHAESALRRGSFRWLPTPNEHTVIFARELGDTAIVCAINKGDHATALPAWPGARDLWHGKPAPTAVKPHSFVLLRLPTGVLSQ
ncbi:MAG: glycoside hydrolase family 13 protein [Kiritimatiellia bacterium]|nr:alpha-amylase [Kiritimatiellia bacterium]MBP9571548.1 alpha-amylase [Kiritimatiellia bacterium]